MKLALLIPLYNHGDALQQTIERLLPYSIPLLIVDDGSDDYTVSIAKRLAAEYNEVDLHCCTSNNGKGAAVMCGMSILHSKGYTHAFQIDADGQHDVKKINAFVEQMHENPQAVITGKPIFDESIPKIRYYGKYITHFFVCLETFSLSVPDTMCGMRIYPLQTCMNLFEKTPICKRMDFDTDIIVRLIWENTPCVWVPIKVIYPENGISHFQPFDDNVRITLMHTRLCLGALARIPQRLFASQKHIPKHWGSIAERGTYRGLRFALWAYQKLGRNICSVLMYPATLYFFLSSSQSRNGINDFLSRVLQRDVQMHEVWKNYNQFTDSLLDRADAWCDTIDADAILDTCPELCDEVLASTAGGFIIGSHLGNLELCRCLEKKFPHKKIHALVHHKNSVKFNDVLTTINPDYQNNLLEVSDITPEVAIDLSEKIDRGDMLAIVGDRTSLQHEGRSLSVPFCGANAPFPEGPFILASLLKCPVYLLFCIKEDTGYRIYFEKFSDQLHLPRKKRADALRETITRYAQRLEYFTRKAPHQWFNFFDFWKPTTSDTTL